MNHEQLRPRVAEVMAKGDQFEVVRERETVEALVKGERIASSCNQ
jgi:diaminopimelate decarboxylase